MDLRRVFWGCLLHVLLLVFVTQPTESRKVLKKPAGLQQRLESHSTVLMALKKPGKRKKLDKAELKSAKKNIFKKKCRESRYRTIDGSCNNLRRPDWGSPFQELVRMLKPAYDDGICRPRLFRNEKTPLPSPRLLSKNCFLEDSPDTEMRDFSLLLMQWGQFLDHDITAVPTQSGDDGCENMDSSGVHPDYYTCGPLFPISIPEDDPYFKSCMEFSRALTSDDVAPGVGEQLNTITAFVDGSVVYGSSEELVSILRSGKNGLLEVSDYNLLPETEEGNCVVEKPAVNCFKAGDDRVNEFPGLTSFQTVFHREHNRLAKQLTQINPSWGDETLFQEARRIVGAIIQKITYSHWLPYILGKRTMDEFGLLEKYKYDKKQNPGILNSFAAAAFRFGHSLITNDYSTFGQDSTDISQMFFKPHYLIRGEGKGIDTIVKGLLQAKSQKVDNFFAADLTEHLFENISSPGVSLDLVSLNIQRGRDHGLPPYLEYKKMCASHRKSVDIYDGLPACSHKMYESASRDRKGFSFSCIVRQPCRY